MAIFANLFGILFVGFAMYDNFRIYKPLAARVGPLFDIFEWASSGWRGKLTTAACGSALLGSLGSRATALSSFLGSGAVALRPLWAAVRSYLRSSG